MAKDLNKVMLTGYLGADPEMRYTPQGTAVTQFRVASGRSYKKTDGTQVDDTEWFQVVAWDKLGEICNQYLTKGTRVYVEGRLQTRSWEKDDGTKGYRTEVIASDMIILSSKEGRGAGNGDADADEAPAPRQAAPARAAAPAANGNGRGAPAPARGAPAPAAAPSRSAARNVPQSIEADEDLPF